MKDTKYTGFQKMEMSEQKTGIREAEIQRIMVRSQPQVNSSRDPILKKTLHKKGMVEWLKVKAPSSNPSTKIYISSQLAGEGG
jgi:hypothetical protein